MQGDGRNDYFTNATGEKKVQGWGEGSVYSALARVNFKKRKRLPRPREK